MTANMGELLQPRLAAADEDGFEEECFALEYIMAHPAVGEDTHGDVVEV